ncbi:MAG: oxygen-dependent coproporphyrinogen oxidase [Rickettsia slovaca]|uniref:Oxygen-dependent coproporphyrinogen-III oxidase n=2 Tax=Rickettsia slovaca TaxID=35794 RepID=H8LP03_RICSL|nr:oxygen-dependent coproporphyrinogen oxidase [Rickettsia slovaca]AEV92808.1 Coproporphyrinogen III oxidase precursor [Rickettsia slovaca 13-B]AFD20355.1 coproporphyrinogen III oxidase [Rickettsia slovaca str. D-CWPP]
MNIENKEITSSWFTNLRDLLCKEFEKIEEEYAQTKGLKPAKFVRSSWQRNGGGGGVMSLMKGAVFEKVGVNISTVFGKISPEFRNEIPGAELDGKFFATGISLVAHLKSPLIPAMHFNTRYIETSKSWFGGGGDLTPFYPEKNETVKFHAAFKEACDKYDSSYYPKFKKQCDEYFYLKHRKEPRGVGGIFYDYLNNGNFEQDFAFTQDVGKALLSVYPEIVRSKLFLPWTTEQKEYQLIRRGRYVEFNLLYDRGTKFGLMTDGNVEAILMSLPPEVKFN